jgi:hypothetical protein
VDSASVQVYFGLIELSETNRNLIMKTLTRLSNFKLLAMSALISGLVFSNVSAQSQEVLSENEQANYSSDASYSSEKITTVNNQSQSINVHSMFSNHHIAKDAKGNPLKQRRTKLELGQERQSLLPLSSGQISSGQKNSSLLDHEFWVYDADTYLEKDIDGDGFYRTFTVEFDVDVSAAYADVYAELYIRFPGGNWTHYYTTDVYEIEGDMTDTYQVTTELSDGYVPDYYDILIDVWEYGETEDVLVATYSEADDNDLYQLPLEDSFEDRYYEENDDHHHAGSFSVSVLFCLMSFMAIRRRRR